MYCSIVPHHVTALFKPYFNPTIESTGSIGVGLVVEPRVTVCSDGDILIGEYHVGSARRVAETLGFRDKRIKIVTPLPVGVGYAVSAATAIAVSLALGSLRGYTVSRLLRLAHESEVLERTGLGDVLAISCGVGLAIRVNPGAPGVGLAECTQIPSKLFILSLIVKREYTGEFVKNYMARGLHEKAEPVILKITESLNFHTFAEEVLRFNIENRLIRDLIGESGESHILKTPGLVTAYGKKGLLIVIVESDRVEDALIHLSKLNHNILYLKPSSGGPQVEVV
ncbi:MAG: hypothetical protein QXG64_05005 [Acidilobaceae archaeon]